MQIPLLAKNDDPINVIRTPFIYTTPQLILPKAPNNLIHTLHIYRDADFKCAKIVGRGSRPFNFRLWFGYDCPLSNDPLHSDILAAGLLLPEPISIYRASALRIEFTDIENPQQRKPNKVFLALLGTNLVTVT